MWSAGFHDSRLEELRETIVDCLSAGATLEEVQRAVIAAPELTEDESAALWLFAWSFASLRTASPETREGAAG